MTFVVKPRPADPARMRDALTELRTALEALPDHHDFSDMASFDAAFTAAVDQAKAQFRDLGRDARITQSDAFCTIAAFGQVATSRLGFVGALEKWLRRIERAVKEE
ncbi:MAG: hypothetical protein EP318_06140 [Rhodobacteraceae bacterium]|nr:MAG: hypothetical protein EP318_06140 [Paracoccaceae bacterium]